MSSVDVVIPCYNYANYLPFSVGSVTSQRDVDVRILIIDDQSPDNTPEVAARLCAADSRVNYLRNERNLGLIGTANAGVMNWASADYVVLLSADDALTPGALARATQVLDANPDMSMAYGQCLLMNDAREPELPADVIDPTWRAIDSKRFLRRNFEYGNPTPSPSVIVRTAIQHKVGGYDPRFRHTSDMDMWMRCAVHGPVGVIHEPGAFYRLHASNMSGEFNNQAMRDRQEVIDTCEAFVERFGRDFPETRDWLIDLKRRFADEAFWLSGRALEYGNMELLAARLAFAKKHHPAPWLSHAAWRFRLKRLLGGALTRTLKGGPDNTNSPVDSSTVEAGAEATAYREQRGTVGWWPEAA
ncbi:MAG: glycosyltransferase [Hyphomonadaceae bacterium]